MHRFFNTYFNFNSKKTAAEILYGIIDKEKMFEQTVPTQQYGIPISSNTNFANSYSFQRLPIIFSKIEINDPLSLCDKQTISNNNSTSSNNELRNKFTFSFDNTPIPTTNICDVNNLINVLSVVLIQSFNYSEYKKLNTFEQNNIKALIISKLHSVAKEYESRFEVKKEIFFKTYYGEINSNTSTSYFKRNGLSYSYIEENSESLRFALKIHFPEKLFTNATLLEKHIRVALQERCAKLLSTENSKHWIDSASLPSTSP